jgi:hypothetical protein
MMRLDTRGSQSSFEIRSLCSFRGRADGIIQEEGRRIGEADNRQTVEPLIQALNERQFRVVQRPVSRGLGH